MPISFLRLRSRWKNRASEGVIVNLGYPFIFHWTILTILLGLLVFTAFKHWVPLLAATLFMLVMAILPRIQSRFALRKVSGNLILCHDRAFPDEKVELSFELVNQGFSLPWLEIEIEVPSRLVKGKTPVSPCTRERLRWITALSSRKVITWSHAIEAKARGCYLLGPLRLRSGDMFGLFPKELVLPHFENLIVYPRIFPLGKLNFPLRALLGEKSASRNIYEDLSRVAGSRDYRHDDPFKHIHWKASAAHNELQTRQYESSTSLSLMLFLDVNSYHEKDEEFEYAVSMAASIAYEAEKHGFGVGLVTDGNPELQIPTGAGRTQLMLILESLARIDDKSQVSISVEMDRLRTTLPAGVTLVLLTLAVTPAISSLVNRLEKEGRSSLLICTENKNPAIASLERIIQE